MNAIGATRAPINAMRRLSAAARVTRPSSRNDGTKTNAATSANTTLNAAVTSVMLCHACSNRPVSACMMEANTAIAPMQASIEYTKHARSSPLDSPGLTDRADSRVSVTRNDTANGGAQEACLFRNELCAKRWPKPTSPYTPRQLDVTRQSNLKRRICELVSVQDRTPLRRHPPKRQQ